MIVLILIHLDFTLSLFGKILILNTPILILLTIQIQLIIVLYLRHFQRKQQ